MSFETPLESSPADRERDIKLATELINGNSLLQRDGFALKMIKDKFVINDKELDAVEWAHNRLDYLTQNPPDKASEEEKKLHRWLGDHFKDQYGEGTKR